MGGRRASFKPRCVRNQVGTRAIAKADDQTFVQDGEETAIRLTLVPLRAGALFLPSVAIRPLTVTRHPLSCETQHLNAATASRPCSSRRARRTDAFVVRRRSKCCRWRVMDSLYWSRRGK